MGAAKGEAGQAVVMAAIRVDHDRADVSIITIPLAKDDTVILRPVGDAMHGRVILR